MRLWNAINRAVAQNKLPFLTVQAYLNAGEVGKSRMLQVDNIGLKSLVELDLLIAEKVGEPANPVPATSEVPVDPQNEDVRSLGLVQFLAKQHVVSVRLTNAVGAAVISGSCPFDTVRAYLDHPRREEELCRIQNLGRGSAKQFERLVLRSIRFDAPKTIAASPNDYGYIDVGSLIQGTLSLLSERQREILNERLVAGKTLEAVAAISGGITRERVRQIEAKALRIIYKGAFFFRESAKTNSLRLCEGELFELSVEVFANLTSSNQDEAVLYLSILKKFDGDESVLGMSQGHVFVCSRFVPKPTWKVALEGELQRQPLPLTLEKILDSITSVPQFYIRHYFRQKWGLRSEDAGVSAANYGTTRMCIDVLRKAGGPLHCSDVRARIYSNFHVELEEHAINATLGRSKEAVITAPGTYALYECIPFAPSELNTIREVARDYLAAKGLFLSSKLLFEAFAGKTERYSETLNHYLVMGIVQDDERFVTKRGNMIGLSSFDLATTYIPLQDEIRQIVQDHGPVTLQEIADRLSDTRRLCNDSGIRQVLFQSPDIIQVGPRTFDVLHRFFESRDEYEEVRLAIRIALLEGRKTTYAIAQDLALLSFSRITPHLIDWLLQSMGDAQSGSGIHELIHMDDELIQYQEAALHSLREECCLENLLSRTLTGVDSLRLEKLVSLDARFLRNRSSIPTTSEAGELASIIKDFDF